MGRDVPCKNKFSRILVSKTAFLLLEQAGRLADPERYFWGKPDPDPHCREKLDPDPIYSQNSRASRASEGSK